MEPFDLETFKARAEELCDSKKLFDLLEDVSIRYERGQIGEYELEAMKEVINPRLASLASIRKQIGEKGKPSQTEGETSSTM